ncbi:hypothetical protein [Streptomyces thermospinosisporus]|uniref:hypothetical protein n=1 Tax=Streptomyces thermospinosisporus TaxID=161482 RepID=UPI0031D63D1D
MDDAEVFITFLTWTAHLLQARKVPAASLVTGLDILAEQLHDFPRALRILTAGRSALHDNVAAPRRRGRRRLTATGHPNRLRRMMGGLSRAGLLAARALPDTLIMGDERHPSRPCRCRRRGRRPARGTCTRR